MRVVLQNPVVLDTWEGPRAAAPGLCRVCGWYGWELWDIGLERDERGAWAWDAEPEAACPCCKLQEVDVLLGGDPEGRESLPAGVTAERVPAPDRPRSGGSPGPARP